jgi:serine carboxypeptidase-like clade 2
MQVGNPLLDNNMNEKGYLEFLWNHGVMSDEVWGKITAHCSFGRVEGKACGEAKDSFSTGHIDPYNIYAPVCLISPNGSLHSSSYVRTTSTSLHLVTQPFSSRILVSS